MNVNKSNNKSVLSIYFIFILLMICVVSLKKNVHVDEIYSYGLSNSNASTICLSFENGIKYEPSVLPYMNYTTVSKGERFNYDNVWQKQTSDVHPPFYYAILHTICSFFPGVYSKWFAGVINIVFAILTLYVFRKLINCFVYDEKVINIMSVTFILSSGILSSISFFRMYIMAMFFVTLYTFLFIYAVGKTELSVKFWIVLPFSAILGVLTHYYCIIYLVSICVVFGVYLLRNKRWKETGLFVGIMAFSALVSLSIFPAMTKHMFAGGRGTQAIDNLSKTSLSEYWDRIKSFYGFIDNQVLGGLFGYIIIFAIFVIILCKKYLNENNNNNVCSELETNSNEKNFLLIKLLLLIVPLMLFFMFVSKSAAYVTDRYIVPIYAISFALSIYIVYVVSGILFSKRNCYTIMCLVATMIIINSWKNVEWPYLYRDTETLLEKAESYSNVDCVCIYNDSWRLQPSFFEVEKYKSVTFIPVNNINLLSTTECVNADELMVLVIGDEKSILNSVLEKCPMLNKYEKIGGFSYASTYHVYGENMEVFEYNICNYDKTLYINQEVMEDGKQNVCLTNAKTKIKVVKQQDGYYVLCVNDRVFDIAKGEYKDNTNIQLFISNKSDAQKWKIVTNSDGSYTIKSLQEQYVLAYDNSGNICLKTFNENDSSQKWWFE